MVRVMVIRIQGKYPNVRSEVREVRYGARPKWLARLSLERDDANDVLEAELRIIVDEIKDKEYLQAVLDEIKSWKEYAEPPGDLIALLTVAVSIIEWFYDVCKWIFRTEPALEGEFVDTGGDYGRVRVDVRCLA